MHTIKGKRPLSWFRKSGIVSYAGLVMAILISSLGSAHGAEKYPVRPIDIIYPYSAGTGSDMMVRHFAEELSKRWGQPVNVINKVGGNGVTGTYYVMSSPPDGYTLLFDQAPISSAQVGMKGLPYDVFKRTFLALAVDSPEVFVLAKTCPWNSLKEMAAAGRKDPASIVWGASSGGRGAPDIVKLQFFEAAGIDVRKTRRVDFTGTGAAVNAVAGGHVALIAGTPAGLVPVVTSGKAKAIAVAADKRTPLFPNAPTTREAGFPTVDYSSWKGFSGPPGVPAPVQEVFVRAIESVLKDPVVIDKLDKQFDTIPKFLGPEKFRAFVQDDARKIERVLKLMTGEK